MAGGNFDPVLGQVRPGTYINVRPLTPAQVPNNARGVVIVPIVAADYGPVGTFISVTSSNLAALETTFGPNFLNRAPFRGVREALKKASEVLAYRPTLGVQAQTVSGNLTVKAKYTGELGNEMRLVILETSTGVFTVQVFLGTSKIYEAEGMANVADLPASDWVEFSGTGALAAVAGSNLAGGGNGTQGNADITAFLDASEMMAFNTLAFPFTDTDLQAAALSKVRSFREEMGKYVRFVCPNFDADYIGIINVTNGVVLEDGTTLSASDCCAWVAAADAAADIMATNTYLRYDGAVNVNGRKTHEESVAAIQNGELFFALFNGEVVVEYDINSLVSLTENLSAAFKDNTVLRTLDGICQRIQTEFRPGKFSNTAVGRIAATEAGKLILREYEAADAIINVDYDADFAIDVERSIGDSMFVTMAVQPARFANKIYVTIVVR